MEEFNFLSLGELDEVLFYKTGTAAVGSGTTNISIPNTAGQSLLLWCSISTDGGTTWYSSYNPPIYVTGGSISNEWIVTANSTVTENKIAFTRVNPSITSIQYQLVGVKK